MNEPVFRRALPADWRGIRALLVTSKLPVDGAQDHLGSFMVAHDESGLIACAGLELYGAVALLRSVAVAEKNRGRRLGQDLVMRLYSLALNEKVETLLLLTDTADAYFRRLGFSVVARAAVPQVVMVSAEFRGACPASATVMLMNLSTS